MQHTLRSKEIQQQPAGRILDSLIQEYVLSERPTRWSIRENEVYSGWFEAHPEMIDNEKFCTADILPRYSTDISAALSLCNSRMLENKILTNIESNSTFWASFSKVPFSEAGKREDVWAKGETQALTICRAALLAV